MRIKLTLLYAVPFLITGSLLLLGLLLRGNQIVQAHSGVPVPPPDRSPDLGALLPAAAVGLLVTGVIAMGAGWLVAGRFLRPLRTITDTAREISATNLHRRLGRTARGGEFTRLAETLDDLFARLEASFAAQRDFVASASHELRTPLTAQRAVLQVALADPDATAGSLAVACRQVLELGAAQEHLIDALLTLATGEQGRARRAPVDLAPIAAAVLDARTDDGVTVARELGAAPASGDPRLVESLIANLVDNAVKHNTAGGHLSVTTGTDDGRAWLAVANTGPVVAPDQVARLFRPFQRLGPQRVGAAPGHGLGLAIVDAIGRAHGATVRAAARPGGGLDIRVTFPR